MGNRLTKHQSPGPVKEDKMKTPKKRKTDANKGQKKSTFQKFISRFQIRSKHSERLSSKPQIGEAKTVAPPPKPPLRNHSERIQSKHMESNESIKHPQWTDIALKVPDSSDKATNEIDIKITPKPPPRKSKIKFHELLDSPDAVVKTISFDQKVDLTPDKRVPVEEPIIVPKKVIEHICDGTHHHVRNFVNGKFIDQIISLTNKEIPQNKSAAKHASTLSLPSYIEHKKKEDKWAPSPSKYSKKKSSDCSLSTDKKVKPSPTAAEKIESYMIRCKSFGSIIPHCKNEKIKVSNKDSDKESIDSWSGLDDWDLGIIEHDVSTDVATAKNSKNSKENTKKKQEDLMNSIKPDIQEFDDLLTAMDKSVNKKIESSQIDSKPVPTTESPKSNLQFSTSKTYPFKKSIRNNVFENDAFFSTQFIMKERNFYCDGHHKPEQYKNAPLAAFDTDKESEKDSAFYINLVDEVDESIDKTETERKNQPIHKKPNVSTSSQESPPKLIPRRKSSSGHSKLLKYIKDEKDNIHTSFEVKTLHKNVTHENVEPTENLNKSEEPAIVPTIKNVDRSLKKITKSEDINNTRHLDQESTISDLVETSSDDTRSTTKLTIETHK